MNFLLRDTLYQREKPYLCLFETPAGFPKTNIRLSKCEDLTIGDIRGRESDFSLQSHGFAIMPMRSKLSYSDFDDDTNVKGQYLGEVAERLHQFTGASRVQIFEHVVSVTLFTRPQDLCMAYSNHCDMRLLLSATKAVHPLSGPKATRDIPYINWGALSVQPANIHCAHRSDIVHTRSATIED
jgi:hypothetical protein